MVNDRSMFLSGHYVNILALPGHPNTTEHYVKWPNFVVILVVPHTAFSRDKPSWWLKEGWLVPRRLITLCAFYCGICGQWQHNGERTAFPGIALNLDTSTVPLHNVQGEIKT